MTLVGSGAFTYAVQQDWFELPEGWSFGWVPAVACDSADRVYVYSRSERPMVVFDREGRFVASWGEEVLKDAHGIFIDERDQIWCVERETHCVRQFARDGELLMTLGTPDQEGAEGEPFRLPTDLALDADGFIYVSDGYGNTCIHKYSPDGEFIKTWGRPGHRPRGIRPAPLRARGSARTANGGRPRQQPHPILRPRWQLPRGMGRLSPSRYDLPRRRYGLCRGTRPAGEHS